MAERLTKKIIKTIQDKYSLGSYLYYDFAEIDDTNKLLNKLGRLEDILEKYGIEDLEQLDIMLFCLSSETKFQLKQLQKLYKKYNINSVEELDKKLADGLTWKRACEFLANKYAEEYFDGRDIEHCFNADKRDKFVKEKIEYFYQQAKKEGENNDTNN